MFVVDVVALVNGAVVALVNGAAADDAIVMSQFSAPGGVPGIAISSDGIVASSAFDSRFIRLWDVATGELVAELQTGLDGSSPPHLTFTPDGDQLLYPDAGHVLRRFPLDVDRLVDLAESASSANSPTTSAAATSTQPTVRKSRTSVERVTSEAYVGQWRRAERSVDL